MKHKHAEVIKAWADGEVIEWRPNSDDEWPTIYETPSWYKGYEYRVKPKENVVYFNVYSERAGILSGYNTLEEANESKSSNRTGVIKATFENGNIVKTEILEV